MITCAPRWQLSILHPEVGTNMKCFTLNHLISVLAAMKYLNGHQRKINRSRVYVWIGDKWSFLWCPLKCLHIAQCSSPDAHSGPHIVPFSFSTDGYSCCTLQFSVADFFLSCFLFCLSIKQLPNGTYQWHIASGKWPVCTYTVAQVSVYSARQRPRARSHKVVERGKESFALILLGYAALVSYISGE